MGHAWRGGRGFQRAPPKFPAFATQDSTTKQERVFFYEFLSGAIIIIGPVL